MPDPLRAASPPATSPTLVARTEFSELFAGDVHVRVAEEYEHGRHQVLRGTGHMIMWEALDETVAALEEFLG